MFENIAQTLAKLRNKDSQMDQIAKLLSVRPEYLEEFEKAYAKQALREEKENENFFKVNAKQAAAQTTDIEKMTDELNEIVERISDDLAAQTKIWQYKNNTASLIPAPLHKRKMIAQVTQENIDTLPMEVRPQLTGDLMMIDIDSPSYIALMQDYTSFKNAKSEKEKNFWYHHFRQGLDILDLDGITYEMLGQNKNSMGYWLPMITPAVEAGEFFKIPNTTIAKVPMTLLQLTRCDYFDLTPTTKAIVDRWAMKVFDLDEEMEYFIKTGTYSSKFDFRNARVKGAQEVKELGEYLLFIHFQALQMASPLSTPCVYGVSTTNDWVVREFIQDKENNPSIYNGMPLHTEYRVFVDFDTDQVVGINPYWDPKVMKDRFKNYNDADTAQNKHDYIIYSAHEKTLMDRYEKNKKRVIDEIAKIIPDIDLEGQWSMDVMQNGNDFWLIDMADAANSALSFCVPENLLKKNDEEWIPMLSEKGEVK